MSPRFYAGLDGGATKTECVIVDGEGRLAAMGVAGPASYHNIGKARALSNIRKSVEIACAEAGISTRDIGAACLGLASMDSERDFDVVRGGTAWVAQKVLLESDSSIALAGAFAGGPGIVAVSGTGSVVLGFDPSGGMVRIGGWGYLIGDEGSAFDLGRGAIMEVARFSDGKGRDPGLFPTIAKEFGIGSSSELQNYIYGSRDPVMVIASLSASISRLATRGNRAASALLEGAGRRLADQVLAASRRLKFGSGTYKVSFIGGAFSSPFLLSSFKRRIHGKDARARVIPPLLRPSFGALILAMRTSGVEISPRLLANLMKADRKASRRHQGSGASPLDHKAS